MSGYQPGSRAGSARIPWASPLAVVTLNPSIVKWATKGLDLAERCLDGKPMTKEELDPARQGLDQAAEQFKKATPEERGTAGFKKLESRHSVLSERVFKDADCERAKDPAVRKAAEEYLKKTFAPRRGTRTAEWPSRATGTSPSRTS